uniref:Uncharacterized protein n=1 Tax=Oryza nivara TaxID=4536 RepID=A0A0E0J311_ORYNI
MSDERIVSPATPNQRAGRLRRTARPAPTTKLDSGGGGGRGRRKSAGSNDADRWSEAGGRVVNGTGSADDASCGSRGDRPPAR